jgi:antitoxin ParD1/3/4
MEDAMSAVTLPQDIETLIDREIARGRFRSREEVIGAGVRLLCEQEERVEALRAAIQEGIDDIENGRFVEIRTAEEADRFFEGIITEGERLLARST